MTSKLPNEGKNKRITVTFIGSFIKTVTTAGKPQLLYIK